MKTRPQISQSWHSMEANEVLNKLATSMAGLHNSEVQSRRLAYGPNRLTSKKQSWVRRIIEPFTSLFVIVMLVAMVISLFSQERIDAIIIAGVVAVNALVYYFQQFSVNRVLADLRSYEDGVVTVVRDNATIETSVGSVVPGDIVYLFEGLKVPADGRLVEANTIHIDESILTGESLPNSKNTDVVGHNAEIYDQKNMVFKGTLVHSGSGIFAVTNTGDFTQLGAISDLASTSDTTRTPIERKIDDITKKIVVGISGVAAVVFGLALVRGIELNEAVRFTLSLVVSVVPEGLPVTLAVVLLLSAKRMASRHALVKNLSSIETMGAVTLIATDKTGTLTKNKLEVAAIFPNHAQVGPAAHASVTMHNGIVLDPLDALLKTFFTRGHDLGKRVLELPFNQSLRLSGVVWHDTKQYYVQLKGAPEAILSHIPIAEQKLVMAQLHSFASKGYRTIAFGHVVLQAKPDGMEGIPLTKLVFDGLIGLADPIRENIPGAIKEAQNAGIKVVMLTGDHAVTAQEIGRQAGLVEHSDQVATSKLLEKPANAKVMQTILSRIRVFGRVLPKHKFNFLKSVKQSEITAMTGDGVNDIPALIEADAGLSMGSGTDAAKDASDIVLLNDNFATIIDAVRLGRSVIANIRKMLFYLISTSLGEAMTMIGALLFGMPLPITAVQVLWVNLVTDSFTVLPIGLSKPESHQMKRPPHDPSAPLLSNSLLGRTIFTGFLTALATLFIFWKLLPTGYDYAKTAAFTALVVAQWANALNATFEHRSWTRIFFKPNWLLLGGIGISMALQALVMFGPLRQAFGIVGLSIEDLLLTIAVPTLVVLIGVDVYKLIFKTAE